MKKIDNSGRYLFEKKNAHIELTHQYFSTWSVAKEIAECFNGLVEESDIFSLKKTLQTEFTKIKNETTWQDYPLNCSVSLVKGKFKFSRR